MELASRVRMTGGTPGADLDDIRLLCGSRHDVTDLLG